jgi:hypothetical protein
MSAETPFKYNPNATDEDETSSPSGISDDSVTWQASEYIDHGQDAKWYAVLIIGTILLTGLVYLLTKEYMSAAIIIILGLIVGLAAKRKPQQIMYEISSSGIRIGEKNYRYIAFRSFSIIQEGGLNSISLLPVKRFLPAMSIYYEPGDEEKIVDIMSEHLPYEEHKVDAIDRLSRRLRF